MKKKILSFLLAFTMLATVAAPAQVANAAESEDDAIVYEANLEDGSEYTHYDAGVSGKTCEIANGVATLSGEQNKALVSKDLVDVYNFVFDTTIKVTKVSDPSQGGVLFRAGNAQAGADGVDGYFFGINPTADEIQLGRMRCNTSVGPWENGDPWYEMAKSSAPGLEEGTPYRVIIIADGDNIGCYVYDEDCTTLYGKIEKTDSRYNTSGRIGLRTHGSRSEFSNIKVYDAETIEDWYNTIEFKDAKTDEDVIEPQKVVRQGAADKITPKKEGYEFVGWYTDKELKTPYDFGKITKDTTVYAKWAKLYNVTFMDGNTVLKTGLVAEGKRPAEPNVYKAGSVFGGWHTDAALTKRIELGEVTGELTVYGKWGKLVNIKFMDADGKSIWNEQDLLSGDTPAAPAEPVKEGFTFAGWYTDAALTTPYVMGAVTKDTTVYGKWNAIKQSSGGTSTSQTVEVTEVKVDKKTLKLGVKETYTLVTTVLPKNATNKTLKYTSDNKNVATVKNGVITAGKNTGKANITVKAANGKSVTVKVTVQKAPNKITVKTTKKTIKKNQSFTIQYSLPKNTASNKITFKSSNTKVATVDAKGKVKGKKKGTATITVQTFNKKKATVKVTVK